MKKLLIGTTLLYSLLFGDGASDLMSEPPIKEHTAEEISAWNFELSPYLAMSNISGTSAIGRAEESELDLDFGQIADALEFGIATHFEALHNNGWGIWLDYNYVSLGGSQSGSRGLGTSLNIDVKQAVFEGQGMYRQNLSSGTIDYTVGLRSWRMKITTDFLTQRKIDESWVDFIVGARWTQSISENWTIILRGDIGAGDSDFTATTAAGFRYNINKYLDVDIQYKALWVDYETGTVESIGHFSYDTTTYGPMLGLNFKF